MLFPSLRSALFPLMTAEDTKNRCIYNQKWPLQQSFEPTKLPHTIHRLNEERNPRPLVERTYSVTNFNGIHFPCSIWWHLLSEWHHDQVPNSSPIFFKAAALTATKTHFRYIFPTQTPTWTYSAKNLLLSNLHHHHNQRHSTTASAHELKVAASTKYSFKHPNTIV